jgi:hypothetical protein
MKRILFLFILITFSACQDDNKTEASVEYILSPESTMVIKFADFTAWQEALSKQSFLASFKNNPIAKFWSIEDLKTTIDIPDNAVLSISSLGNNKLIKTLSFEIDKDTKFKIESKQSYNYDGVTINTIESNESEVYYAYLGGKAVLCTSKIILENVIRNYKNDISNPEEVVKLLNVLSNKSTSIIINNDKFREIIFQFFDQNILEHQLNLSNYSGFDVNLDDDKVLLSGIVFSPKEGDKLWTRFKNVQKQKSTTVEVIPSNFINVTSILFSDFEKLSGPKDKVELQPKIDSLYLNIREISSVNLSNGKATILASNNINQTFDHLKKSSTSEKSLGDNAIYRLNQSFSPGNNFSSIINVLKVEFYAVYMDYILFSDTLDTVENLIIQINNQNVISNQANYNNHLESLNNECHIQWITNLSNQDAFFDEHSKEAYESAFKSIKWDKHEIMMSQLIVEEDFGYLNMLNKRTVENQKNTIVEQQVRLKSENPIINSPAFFENWRTGQQDVVYQDSQNKLYLKDTKGNMIWSKKIDNPVIGKISNIDIFQNKRIQIAFATKNKIYVVDKNGKDVQPFPLKVKDEITQGLSVFDYDNNGKYRFTVVLDDKVKMYEKNAKRVKGFKFNKAKSTILYPAKHIRMDSKDYILVQDESGILHILDRRGNKRVSLDKSLKFSENEWFENESYFTSVNNNGEVLRIDEKGGLSKSEKEYINPKYSANDNNLVVITENKIYINSSEAELPYGLYSNPIISGDYVGFADKQAQKIYILNNNAEVVEGFPVFGKDLIDFYSNENEMVILCQENDNSIIVYRAEFR